jgi:membrane protease YdiL (CAAX protease family)
VLSAIAGLFYGVAYQRTGRVEGSILAHATLNTGHLLLLTYPALAR